MYASAWHKVALGVSPRLITLISHPTQNTTRGPVHLSLVRPSLLQVPPTPKVGSGHRCACRTRFATPPQPNHHPLTYRYGSRRAHKVVQLWLSHHLRRGNQKAQGMSSPSSRRSQGSGGLLRYSSFLAPSSASVAWRQERSLRSPPLTLRALASLRASQVTLLSFQGAPLSLSPHWRA